MLEARIEQNNYFPAAYGGHVPRTKESAPKVSETVDFIGFLYETPEQRHPQETTKGWLVRVSGASPIPDGVYSIEVDEEERPLEVFASAARQVTNLPDRKSENYYPSFGLNEVTLSTETFDLKKPKRVKQALSKTLRAKIAGYRYKFV